MLTQERLKEVLSYDPDTGIFTRLQNVQGCFAGSPVGTKTNNGYILIGVDRKRYLAHRLAWFYMNGSFPKIHLDHINRIKSDNRIANLREVGFKENSWNVAVLANNTSGVTGVYRSVTDGRWTARIKAKNKNVYLGTYLTFAEAVAARRAGEILVQGEFFSGFTDDELAEADLM